MVQRVLQSFRKLPIAAQCWTAGWVFPLNVATIGLLDLGPYCHKVMTFALLGLTGVFAVTLAQKGVTRLAALPKLMFWTPMIFLILMVLLRYELDPIYASFLLALAVTNLIQVVWAYSDWLDWWRGDRGVL